ncbi:MAG: hypothetical protein ABIJ56_06020 [Pseudomonadota bacterium]
MKSKEQWMDSGKILLMFAALLVFTRFAACDGEEKTGCGIGLTMCGERCANLQTDTQNCGSCGNACALGPEAENALAECDAGECVIECSRRWTDLDGDESNGCEYECEYSSEEKCNGLDDDCNGEIDDGTTEGEAWDCVADFETIHECMFDCDGDLIPGGAYCPETCFLADRVCYPKPDVCDGLDNNCDTIVDNGTVEVDDGDDIPMDCILDEPIPCEYDCEGTPLEGTTPCPDTCVMAYADGPCAPPEELCNGEDDDCDTVVDNGETGSAPWDCVVEEPVTCQTECDPGDEMTGTGTCPDTCFAADTLLCAPPEELCNDRDDDCDDEVDEGVFGKKMVESRVSANDVDEMESVDVAWNGEKHFIVWDQYEGDVRDIFFSTMDEGGIVSTAEVLPNATGEDQGQRSNPAVAYDSVTQRIGTVWVEDAGDLSYSKIRFVSTNRTGGDKEPAVNRLIDSGTSDADEYDPAILPVYVSGMTPPTHFAVAWVSEGSSHSTVKLARVSTSSGALLDEAIVDVGTLTGSKARPGIAWNGTHYVVVWTEGNTGNTEVFATILDSSAVVVPDKSNIRVLSMLFDVRTHAVVWDGNHFAVLATGKLSDGVQTLHMVLIDSEGETAGSVELVSTLTPSGGADLIWTGDPTYPAFIMAWDKSITGASNISVQRIMGGSDSVDDYLLVGPIIDVPSVAGNSLLPSIAFTDVGEEDDPEYMYGLGFINDHAPDDLEAYFTILGCL